MNQKTEYIILWQETVIPLQQEDFFAANEQYV